MIDEHFFFFFYSHLTLQINHFNYGSFQKRLHSYDTIPYNRIYAIHPESGCKVSFIGKRGCEGARKLLLPGHIYFIPAGFFLEYDFSPRLTFFAIHFSLTFFYGMDLFHNNNTLLSCYDDERVISQIWRELEKKGSLEKTMRIKSRLFLLASHFFFFLSLKFDRISREKKKYTPILEWIHRNPHAGLSVKELAEKGGLSVDSLSRNFSKDMGITLKQYLNQELTKEASRYLLCSDLRIKEIAESLRFSDEFYFNRFFKKQTGQSPGNFRKRYQNITER